MLYVVLGGAVEDAVVLGPADVEDAVVIGAAQWGTPSIAVHVRPGQQAVNVVVLACPATWMPEQAVVKSAVWHVLYVVLPGAAVEDPEETVVLGAVFEDVDVAQWYTPAVSRSVQVRPGQQPVKVVVLACPATWMPEQAVVRSAV